MIFKFDGKLNRIANWWSGNTSGVCLESEGSRPSFAIYFINALVCLTYFLKHPLELFLI